MREQHKEQQADLKPLNVSLDELHGAAEAKSAQMNQLMGQRQVRAPRAV